MKQAIFNGLRMLVVMTILTGVIYPLFVTVVAQVFYADRANGSLLTRDNQVVGSELIGQQTDDPRYFWWRPSAVSYMQGATLDNPGSSGATNYGWTSTALTEAVSERTVAFRQQNSLSEGVSVPTDMLFASGSGLDPHISPEAARLQIDRVAATRDLDQETVAALVEQHIEMPQLGFLGKSRVNVLRLNLALDALE
jgi:K+-transporting ATPase ATPase C chain